MIINNLSNYKQYLSLSPYIEKAFEFLQNTNLKELSLGKHLIDGHNVLALVNQYNTKTIEESKWEAHFEYLDIQYMVEGEELIGYIDIAECEVSEPYDAKKDIYFLTTNKNGTFPLIKENNYAIILPNFAHMPCVIPAGEISKSNKKIVLKVKVSA